MDTDTRVREHACPPLSAEAGTDMDTNIKNFAVTDADIKIFETADTDADTDIVKFWIADMKDFETAFSFGLAHITEPVKQVVYSIQYIIYSLYDNAIP